MGSCQCLSSEQSSENVAEIAEVSPVTASTVGLPASANPDADFGSQEQIRKPEDGAVPESSDTSKIEVVEQVATPSTTDSEANAALAESSKFVTAVKQGRYIAAFRELAQKENVAATNSVDAVSLERVGRLSALYEQGMQLIQKRPSAFKVNEQNAKLNLSWGVSLENGKLNMVSEIKFSGLSLLECCALELERELENYLNDDAEVTALAISADVHECAWQRISNIKSIGTKTHDVLVETVLDALDEPDQSLFFIRCSPSVYDATASALPSGYSLPPTLEGHDRCPYIFVFTKLTPTKDGVIVTEASSNILVGKVASIMNILPGFLLKKAMRPTMENKVKRPVELVANNHSIIDEKIAIAPRSEFYDRVRLHVSS